MKSLDFLKEGFMEDASEAHQDHEVQMARQECFHAAEHALALHKLLRNISEAQGLEGWVSSKITLANDYLQRVREYLEYELLTKDINDEAPVMSIAEDQESKKKNLVVEYKVSGAEQGSENYTINDIELNALQNVASRYYDRPVIISQSKDTPDLYTINVAMTVGPINYGSYNATTKTASIAKRMTDKGDQLQKVLQDISEAQSAEERAESDRQMQDFLSKGGEIQQVRANRGPRRSGASLASHHIGGMGDARTGRRSQMRGLGSNPTGKLLVAKESEGVAEDQLDEIDIDTLNQLASHAVNTMGQSGANFAAGATGGLVGGAIAGGTKKAVDWYYKQKQKKAKAERKKSQHQGVAEGMGDELDRDPKKHQAHIQDVDKQIRAAGWEDSSESELPVAYANMKRARGWYDIPQGTFVYWFKKENPSNPKDPYAILWIPKYNDIYVHTEGKTGRFLTYLPDDLKLVISQGPKQGVAEGKKPDRYHIVGKDGKPVNLASYADRDSAIKDRDEKYPGAVVQQVGPRGKIKGVAEGAKCNHTMEGTNCPVHGLKECGSYGKVEEMSAGSVATVVNPPAKNKSKVGTLFGGTYKQKKVKEAKQMTFPGENTKPAQRPGDQVQGTEKATKPNPFKHRLVGNE